MKILSFDVGIVNLAYCIIEDFKIVKWEVISLVNNKDYQELYIDLINNLDSRKDYLLDDIDTVLIEKQPSLNPKMRIISGCLQTYFFIRGVVDCLNKIKSIKFYSPKHKLKCYTSSEPLNINASGSKYSRTKKMGVAICEKKLIEYNEPEEILTFFNKSKKKDDLADCYLQALTYVLTLNKTIKTSNNPNIKINIKSKLTKKSIKDLFLTFDSLELLMNSLKDHELTTEILNLYNIPLLTTESIGIILKDLNLKKRFKLTCK
jgi:hypothetical protein